MLKSIIWFNDIELFNKCETEARRIGLTGAQDFIVQSAEDYVVAKCPNIFEKNNGKPKSENNNEKKCFKKNIDLWLALKEQAIIQNMTVSGLMEHICGQILTNKPDVLTPAPLINEQLPNTQENNQAKLGGGYTIDPPWKFRKE